MQLKDKVVIVTGAAQGIGRACAKRLAAEGARVVLSDVQDGLGMDAAKAIDGEARFVSCDVGDKAQVNALIEATVQAYGGVDVCVSNAGIIHTADFLDIEEADFDRWQRYVHARPDSHCADLAEWRPLFRELYGIEDHSYACLEQDRVVGALSLYHIRSPFLGKMLVTCPFYGYGGIYWENEAARDALLERADAVARELAVDYVETHPPETLRFDPPHFEELVEAAARLYEAITNQDGAPEKLEAARRLEAFLAFTLKVDRDRFSQ